MRSSGLPSPATTNSSAKPTTHSKSRYPEGPAGDEAWARDQEEWQEREEAARVARANLDAFREATESAQASLDQADAGVATAVDAMERARIALRECEKSGTDADSRTEALPEEPSDAGHIPPPVAVPEEDRRKKTAVIGVVTNGSNDSINKYQPFRVIVEIDTKGKPPPEEIEIKLSSGTDDETLTIAWDGNVGGRARYVSQPITLDSGAAGEGTSTCGPFEFTTGGFNSLWFEEGEQVVVSYNDSSTSFAAYETWVQQGTARCAAVIERQKAFWTRLLEELQGIEGPAADKLRARGKLALEMIERAEAWKDKDEGDTVKLAWLQAYAENIGREWDEWVSSDVGAGLTICAISSRCRCSPKDWQASHSGSIARSSKRHRLRRRGRSSPATTSWDRRSRGTNESCRH